MPFDLEDVLPFVNEGRFKALPVDETPPEDPALAACACPVCSGQLSIITTEDPGAPRDFLNADSRGGGTVVNGKPSLSVDDATRRLINDGNYSWNDWNGESGNWTGAPTVVSFAFRSSILPANMPDDTTGFSRFNLAQINATLLALSSWSDVANITFVRVGSGTSGEGAYSNDATILFGNYNSGADGAAAFAYYAGNSNIASESGDVWVNSTLSYNVAPGMGNYGALTLVHEIGHALGFSHPGEYNAGEGGGPITYANDAEYYEDSQQFTVMSYFTEGNTGGNFGPLYPATVMLDDIAAAQRVYGANMSTRTGDTVYGFNANADRPWFIALNSESDLVFAVWDAGGTDTFDFSFYSEAGIIDLRQGHFSSVGGLVGNVAIAIGAIIENAIGGLGADTIHGNSHANRLQGSEGADTLTGLGGADVFVATVGGGADTITDFVVGTDKIDVSAFGGYQSIVQNGADTLITVASGVTIRLTGVTASTVTAASFITSSNPPPFGYNLINGTASGETLNGTAASDQIYGLGGDDTLNGGDSADWLEGGADNDTLNGDAGDDHLDGGAGADILNGGVGADEMIGGAGDDAYVIDNAGDTVTEGADAGADSVSTSLAGYTLAANVENLTGTVGTGQTLTGNSLDNTITGGAGTDTLNGGEGNDTLIGGGGADAMTGGAGNDTYLVDNAGDTAVEGAGAGTDTVQTSLAGYTLAANVENLTGTVGTGQTLTGNSLANTIVAGAGADTIDGGAGNDTLTGNGGADIFVIGSGGGTDTITDFVVGSDRIDLSAFGNYISIGQSGADTVIALTAAINLILKNVQASTITNASFIGLAGPNVINGTASGETLNGTSGVDQINGLGGNDILNGLGGADTLDGGEGDDTLDGGTGADAMTGGAGNDAYSVDNVGDTVTEGASAGTDTVQTSLAAYALGANLENLTGTVGTGQTLTGNSLANTINGGAGADTLDGGVGADTLAGGAGNDTYVVDNAGDSVNETSGAGTDTVQTSLAAYTLGANVENLTGTVGTGQTLTGNSLANTVVGGAGADVITGGAGADTLTGNGGADVFVATTGGGADTINDFVIGTDKIDVSAFGSIVGVVQQGADALVTVATGVTFLLKNTTAANVTNASFVGLVAGPNVINGTAAANTLVGTSGVDQINGLGGNDTISGDAADDVLDGGIGNDRLDGGAGADAMTGGAGNDTFVIDNVGDTVSELAGEGTDLVETTLAAYTLGAELENLTGTSASGQTLTGNAAANVVTGGDANDTLNGLDGNDTLNGGLGADTVNGGAGLDKLYGGEGGDTLNGGDDADRLYGEAGADTLVGGAGNDTIEGGAGADVVVVTVGGGVDTVADFTVGEDRIDLTAYGAYTSLIQSGTDTVITFATGVSVRLKNVTASTVTDANFIGLTPTTPTWNEIGGTASGETLNGTTAADHIQGLGGNDTLNGANGDDWLEGGEGDDTLSGGAGADRMVGGAGSDVYTVDNAGDLVEEAAGTAGVDRVQTALASHTLAANVENLTGTSAAGQALTGNTGNNAIVGAGGADTLDGANGDDTLTGNAGADSLTGGAGADVFVGAGGGGADTVTDFVVGTDRIDVSAFGSVASIVQQGSDTLVTVASGVTFLLLGVTASSVTDASFIGLASGVNVINGTAAANVLNGTAGVDQINGLGGNDTLSGLGGDDALDGGIGNDRLDGGTGADAMTGGAGNDTYVVDDAGDSIVELAAEGTDVVETSLAGYTLADNVETLIGTVATGQTLTGNALANVITGGDGGDTLGGADGNDTLTGGLGADVAYGGAGVDKLYGGDDNDLLSGGDDADRLYGEAGADTLVGGAGNDTLEGGAGADIFVATVGGGVDTISDFVVGEDKIDLSAFGAYTTIIQSGADTVVTFAAGTSMRLKNVTASTVTDASFVGLPSSYNVINGTAANNSLIGTAGADHISGLDGDDELNGLEGDDLLEGGAGDDMLGGGFGNDIMRGGEGSDVYTVNDAGDVVEDTGSTGIDQVSTGLAGYTLGATIERLFGFGGVQQTLTGNALANVIWASSSGGVLAGLGGDDILNGNSAADTLTGGDGADTLFGGGGADVFVATAGGGADTVNDFVVGTDKIDVSAFGSIVGVTQQGSDALVTVASGVTFLLLGVSAASVTNASFIGLVAPTWNEIVGTSAAETINGTADADHIQGLDGVDRLFGLGGDDWLQGGAGNDVIVGGAGADLLEGGAGSDTFRYDSAADFNVGGALDRILDFGTGDRINLSAIDANTGVAGDQAFTVVGGFTSVAGQLMTSYDAGEDETLVQMDVNGDGVADYALIVEGNATLAWVL